MTSPPETAAPITAVTRQARRSLQVAALLLGCLGVACKEPPRRILRVVKALDDGTALVLWKDHDGHGMGRVDLDGRLTWSTRLSGRAQALSTRLGISVHDRVVGIRELRNRWSAHPSANPIAILEGFSLEDGRRVWEVALVTDAEELHDGVGLHSYVTNVRTPSTWGEVVTLDGISELVHIDPASGRVLGRVKLPIRSFEAPMVVGERIVLHSTLDAFLFGATVAPLSFPSMGRGCIVQNDYVRIVDGPSGSQLVSWPLADPARAVVVELGIDYRRVTTQFTSIDGCAHYKDQIVVQTTGNSNGASQLRVLDRSGNQLGELSLEGRISHDSGKVHGSFPEHSNLGGTLTRFVPYLILDRRGVGRLVMVDLERRAVVWSTEVDTSASVFHVKNLWYLVVGYENPTIAVVNGDDGTLDGAVRIDGAPDITPTNVRGGSLWVARNHDWHPATEMPMARLDATTLEPRHVSDLIGIHDAMNDPQWSGLPR